MNIEIIIFTVLEKDLKNVSEETAHLATLKSKKHISPADTAKIEKGMAEKSSSGTRQRWQKLGLVWRNRKIFMGKPQGSSSSTII
jgi:hypothetical protein